MSAQQFFLCPHCREPGCKLSDFDIAIELQRQDRIVAEDIRESWRQWRILVEINSQTRARRQEEARRERQAEEDANIALLLHESLNQIRA